MAFLIIRMDKPMKKILLVAGAAMALAGCGEKGDLPVLVVVLLTRLRNGLSREMVIRK